jgi:hypothetical protein
MKSIFLSERCTCVQVESNNEATLKKDVEALNRRCMVSLLDYAKIMFICVYVHACMFIYLYILTQRNNHSWRNEYPSRMSVRCALQVDIRTSAYTHVYEYASVHTGRERGT